MILALVSAISTAVYGQRTYKLNFSDFNELKVVDGINVDYHWDVSRAGEVEFEADDAVASAVMFECSKEKLTVKLGLTDTPLTNLPTVRVYSSYLTGVSNEGDSLVRVLSVAPGPKFTCRVMGNGRLSVRDVNFNVVKASILSGRGIISIYGCCREAELKVTGAGHIQADGLQSETAKVTMTGTGTVNCYAENSLNVGGLSGKVFYRGHPSVKERFPRTVKVAAEN